MRFRYRWSAEPCYSPRKIGVNAALPLESSPLILGYVLGPLMEEYLRRAKLLARGDATAFFTRPLSLAFMIGTVLILSVMIAPAMRKRGEGT